MNQSDGVEARQLQIVNGVPANINQFPYQVQHNCTRYTSVSSVYVVFVSIEKIQAGITIPRC